MEEIGPITSTEQRRQAYQTLISSLPEWSFDIITRYRQPPLYNLELSTPNSTGVIVGESFNSQQSYLHFVAVQPEQRRTGIGRRLVELFEEQIIKRFNTPLLTLDTYDQETKLLFKKLGYQEQHTNGQRIHMIKNLRA